MRKVILGMVALFMLVCSANSKDEIPLKIEDLGIRNAMFAIGRAIKVTSKADDLIIYSMTANRGNCLVRWENQNAKLGSLLVSVGNSEKSVMFYDPDKKSKVEYSIQEFVDKFGQEAKDTMAKKLNFGESGIYIVGGLDGCDILETAIETNQGSWTWK